MHFKAKSTGSGPSYSSDDKDRVIKKAQELAIANNCAYILLTCTKNGNQSVFGDVSATGEVMQGKPKIKGFFGTKDLIIKPAKEDSETVSE